MTTQVLGYRILTLGTCGGGDAPNGGKTVRLPFDQRFGPLHYNPVTQWDNSKPNEEREVKNLPHVVLAFLLTPAARTLTASIEACEMFAAGRSCILVPGDFLETGAEIDGETLSQGEIAACNAGRRLVAELARKAGVPIFSSSQGAVEYLDQVGFGRVPRANLPETPSFEEDVYVPHTIYCEDESEAMHVVQMIVDLCLAAGSGNIRGKVYLPDIEALGAKAKATELRSDKDLYRFYVYLKECMDANGVSVATYAD